MNVHKADSGGFAVAAVVYGNGGDAAVAALWQVASRLQQAGLRVAGLLNPLDKNGRHIKGEIVALNDGRRFRIFQNLGPGAQGCTLDGGALSAAGAVIREAMDSGPHVVLINKFGQAETDNRGLIAEFVLAAEAGVPVLTTVEQRFLEHWRAFSGSLGGELAADADAIIAWYQSVCGKEGA